MTDLRLRTTAQRSIRVDSRSFVVRHLFSQLSTSLIASGSKPARVAAAALWRAAQAGGFAEASAAPCHSQDIPLETRHVPYEACAVQTCGSANSI
jgi:hypothetical protein